MSFQKILTITKEEKIVKKIDYVNIYVSEIVLNTSATIITEYLSSQYGCVDITKDVITGDLYKRWGNSDDYIYNYICEKYGLHRIPNA